MLKSITLFGQQVFLGSFFDTLGYILMFILTAVHLKEYKEFSTLHKIVRIALRKENNTSFFHNWIYVLVEAYILFIVLIALIYPLNDPLTRFFMGSADANYFPYILFVPVFYVVFAIILKISPLKLTDFGATVVIPGLICFKFSCFCNGCCYGIECASSPFYNYSNERYELPIQLIEMGCAVIMYIIILLLRRKKHRVPGVLYPVFMLMYCGSRFISEFWRDDYPAIWGRMTGYHIQCIIGFVLGAIYLFIVLKWGERISEYFEKKNKAFLDRQIAKIKERRPKIQHAKKRKK